MLKGYNVSIRSVVGQDGVIQYSVYATTNENSVRIKFAIPFQEEEFHSTEHILYRAIQAEPAFFKEEGAAFIRDYEEPGRVLACMLKSKVYHRLGNTVYFALDKGDYDPAFKAPEGYTLRSIRWSGQSVHIAYEIDNLAHRRV